MFILVLSVWARHVCECQGDRCGCVLILSCSVLFAWWFICTVCVVCGFVCLFVCLFFVVLGMFVVVFLFVCQTRKRVLTCCHSRKRVGL